MTKLQRKQRRQVRTTTVAAHPLNPRKGLRGPYRAACAGLLLATVLWPATAPAQNVETINCSGPITGGSFADVIVNGGTCTLNGVTVFGSVLVDGGALNTNKNGMDKTRIFGSVQVTSGVKVTLKHTDVMGDVKLEAGSGHLKVDPGATGAPGSILGSISLKDSGKLTVGAEASTGELLVENSGAITVSGEVDAIQSVNSGHVDLDGATVFPGGVAVFTGGHVTLCGAQIGIKAGMDGSGGVEVKESGKVLAVAGMNCPTSTIEGSVLVEKGTGPVNFVDATLTSGDFVVIERIGNVRLEGATVSDVKIEKSSGNIMLLEVTTDSDTTIKENTGKVMIAGSTIGSDVEINQNGSAVMIVDSAFSLEDVLISKNGAVTIDHNCDMRLTVSENTGSVAITNNTGTANPLCVGAFGFTDADVSKNTGGVNISGNTGETLVCADNSPAPTGSGNMITFTDGQCAGF